MTGTTHHPLLVASLPRKPRSRFLPAGLSLFTQSGRSRLVSGMSENTDIEELAYFDMLGARQGAIAGAVGALCLDNVSSERLRRVIVLSQSEIIKLAARIVLYQRGEDS